MAAQYNMKFFEAHMWKVWGEVEWNAMFPRSVVVKHEDGKVAYELVGRLASYDKCCDSPNPPPIDAHGPMAFISYLVANKLEGSLKDVGICRF